MTRTRGGHLSTRQRILFEASNLFARRGYHGTTTRQIADAVGIRQPSLFHHFPSKRAIMEALLAFDLDAFSFVGQLARAEGPAADRLYQYIRHDVELVSNSPYNLSGLYTEEVMGDPHFGEWAARGDRLHDAVEKIVKDGVASGEFVQIDPGLVREGIYGLILRLIAIYSGGRAGARPELGDQVAAFVLRGLLRDPSRLDAVRAGYRWSAQENAGISSLG
jgi:AcrR family transcriptional regulator